MSSLSFNRSLLFGALLVQKGFITRSDLSSVVECWTRRKSQSLAQKIVELGYLSEEEREQLDAMINSLIAAHQGDARRCMQAMKSVSDVTEELLLLDDTENSWLQQHALFVLLCSAVMLIAGCVALGAWIINNKGDRDLAEGQHLDRDWDNAEPLNAPPAPIRVPLQDADLENILINPELQRLARQTGKSDEAQELRNTVAELERNVRQARTDKDCRRAIVAATSKLEEQLERLESAPGDDGQRFRACNELGDRILNIEAAKDIDSANLVAEHFFQFGLGIAQKRIEKEDTPKAQRDLAVMLDRLGTISLRLGRIDDALAYSRRACEIYRQQAEADPNSGRKKIELCFSMEQLGDALSALGRKDDALIQYQTALTKTRELADADPKNAKLQRGLELSHNKLGALLQSLGRHKDALAQYQAGLQIARSLNKADPDNTVKQYDLSYCYSISGSAYVGLGQFDEALLHYQETLAIRERMAAAEPDDESNQYNLSATLRQLGNVFLKVKQFDNARTKYQAALTIDRKLASNDVRSVDKQLQVAMSYDNLAEALLLLGFHDDAVQHFQEGLEIRRVQRQAAPDEKIQDTLAYSFERLGDVLQELGRHEDSSRRYQECETLIRARLEADPDNAQRQRSLVSIWLKIGAELRLLERHAEAFTQLYEAEQLSLKLAKDDPSSADKQRDVMLCHFRLGELHKQVGQFAEGQQRFSQGITVLDGMIAKGQLVEASRREKAACEWYYQFCLDAKLALGDWEELLKLGPEKMPKALATRGYEMAKRGERAQVLQATVKLLELQPQNRDNFYNAACLYTLSGDLLIKDKSAPTDAENSERQKLQSLAIDCLKQSIAAGWDNFEHMRKDKDLSSLRGRPDFEALFPK